MKACIICTEEKLNSLEHAKSIFRQTLCTQTKQKKTERNMLRAQVCVFIIGYYYQF